MKRKTLLLTALLVTGLSHLATAAGISLSVAPSSSTVATGSTTTINLTISGLGAMSAPSLSAFDLNLQFDPAILSVSKVVFGSSLPPNDQLNLGGFGTISGSDISSPGLLHLYEVSLDDPATLDTKQRDAFTLAEITFTGQTAGNTALNLAVAALGDAQGNPLSATTITNGSVAVTSNAVAPEPASLLLAGAGGVFLAIGALRSRRQHRSAA